jgi:hypothetical protein
MTTLDEAWEWYRAAAEGTKRLAHFSRHWAERPDRGANPWIDQLRLDNVLRAVDADQMAREAKLVEDELDDLAVLVLFSVFEATVRDLVEEQVAPEVAGLRHPTLVKAGKDVLRAIEEGSFFQILEPFKSAAVNDLVEQINQIRRYRNWVAHGRRPEKKPGAMVEPAVAYQRLKQFLALIQPAPPGGTP